MKFSDQRAHRLAYALLLVGCSNNPAATGPEDAMAEAIARGPERDAGTHSDGSPAPDARLAPEAGTGLDASPKHDAWLAVDAGTPVDGSPAHDAWLAVDAGTPVDGSSAPNDAGLIPCNAQCDCPGGATCTIDHVCQVDAVYIYTQSCDDTQSCGCGNACMDGYCPPFVGSLTACQFNCDCGGWEVCAAGKCIVPDTNVTATGCQSDTDCGQCSGTVCVGKNTSSIGQCAPPDECFGSGDCLIAEGSGFGCKCPNGTFTERGGCLTTVPSYEDPIVPGVCTRISGQSFLNESSTAVEPGGINFGCGFSPSVVSTVLVSGVSGPVSSVYMYAEFAIGAGSGTAGFTLSGNDQSFSFALNQPATDAKWELLETVALTDASMVNGTWSICAASEFDQSIAGTITRWGFYVQ